MLVVKFCTSKKHFDVMDIDKMVLGRNTRVGVKGEAISCVNAVLHYFSLCGLSSVIFHRFIFSCLTSFFSSIPSQYVSPLSSEDGGPHSYQHEGDVVIIVPPLNPSLDDDQEQGSPKTTDSTSKYRIQQIYWNSHNKIQPHLMKTDSKHEKELEYVST